jgi:hypothetical protein
MPPGSIPPRSLIGCIRSPHQNGAGAFLRNRGGMPPLPPSTSLQLSTALLYFIMFTYLPTYRVLICVEHHYAVYSLDEHLKRHHGLPAAKRRELRAAYAGLAINAPTQISLPAPNSPPIAQLGRAQDAFLCCQQEEEDAGAGASATVAVGAVAAVQRRCSCSYITTNRKEMRTHTNKQHSVKLTRWLSLAARSYKEHAARL